MPTYEYRCSHCSHEFEETQSIKASPLVTCPQCKQDRLFRLISSGGGMIFKGSGFYHTDYKAGNSTKNESSTDTATEKKKDDPAKKGADPSPPPATETKSET